MTTKTVDNKGRVALGKDFADHPVIIERVGPNEIRVIKARVIPEDEAWLWGNEEAMGMVKRGIEQAKRHEFVDSPPDLDADDDFVDELDD
jgi:hypothetical protein